MKPVVLASILLIAQAAMADRQSQIAWVELTILVSDDSETGQLQELKDHGLSDDGAIALREYVQHGNDTLGEVWNQIRESGCNRRATFQASDFEKFAEEIEQADAAYHAIMKNLVDNVGVILSPADEAILWEILRHRPDPTFVEITLATMLRGGKIELAELLDRECSGVTSANPY